ncbi:MAG: M23 family metallopeptidase [Clostridiales bacterium]|nr:M23 family metallopeptidase [Clostridiales bacterium]
MNNPIKTVVSAVVCAAALFIPSYIAIANYVMAQNAPVSENSISSLEITDPNGELYKLSSDNTNDAAVIANFVAINNNAIAQPSLPEPLVGTNYFEFKYYTYDRVSTYKYYFTNNPTEAYYVDNGGKAYRITEDDASSFLATSYARCLYNTTSFPKMTVSGETIDPSTANWQYEVYGGEYIPLEGIQLSSESEKVHYMKGAFALNFDNQPDFCTVTINDHGTIVYSDIYENIANASLEGKTIDVTVEAKWYGSEDETCYGDATYKFKAKILLPAVFYLGETSIDPGEFVVITAKNVDDVNAVGFASEPDIGFTPKFFMDGDYARALIPISYDYTGSDVKFTFSYGEVTQEMTLDINSKTFGNSSIDVSAAVVAQTRTAQTLSTFESTMAPIVAETESVPLWSGTFLTGLPEGKDSVQIGFGRFCTIKATGETYRHDGVDYVPVASGTDVLAVNNGKVVYAGYLDYSGYTVVIDHGLGLKSWYCHMSSLNANVGDAVSKGDVIGYVGSTGFTNKNTLHLGMSVYDVPVCPYDLWDYGVLMTD